MFRVRNVNAAARRPSTPDGARRRCAGLAEPLERRTLLASVSGMVYDDIDGDGTFDSDLGEYGFYGVTVYHDVNNNAQFDSGLASIFAPAFELPRAIRDGQTTVSRIVVEDMPGNVRDVDVTVYIQHPYTFDLEAVLISPAGTEVPLFFDVGLEDFFGRSEDFTGTVLDDEAAMHIQDGEPPFPGRYQPDGFLSDVDGEPMNGTWTLMITDWYDLDEGWLNDWGLTFDTGTGEPNTMTDFEGNYTLAGLSAGTYRVRQVLFDGYRQTQPAANAAHVVTLTASQNATGRNFGQAAGVPPASVVGRHLFYNNSASDGSDPAADARDDAAIAPDKRALQRGQTSSVDNYSNYTRGINGVMVDIAGMPTGTTLSAADFGFRAGNDTDPSGWSDLAVSPTVTVRRGQGLNGSDRVTLTWPDGTILRQWLEVTVLPTFNNGLSSRDVFYFGNLPGEVGDSPAAARVTATDVTRVRREVGTTASGLDDWFDFNRDGRINVVDYMTARVNVGQSLATLTAPAASPALFADVPVTQRRTGYRPARVWEDSPTGVLA
jgi:subtilisin-like proprotein convertase family protein